MSAAKAVSTWKSWLTTTDHKRIGLLYFWTAFAFFLIGGVEALIIRAQLARPGNTVVSAETFNQLFTMHGTTMVFLALMPLSAAFFNYIVPLQIGARDVAFPRLNAFSYWVFLLGGLFLNASWLLPNHPAPDAGWFGYANLTSREFSPGPNIDFWLLGLQILGVASLAAGFNFIVTILNLRAPGMKMMRLPVFSWMTLVTSFLIITAFPVITVSSRRTSARSAACRGPHRGAGRSFSATRRSTSSSSPRWASSPRCCPPSRASPCSATPSSCTPAC